MSGIDPASVLNMLTFMVTGMFGLVAINHFFSGVLPKNTQASQTSTDGIELSTISPARSNTQSPNHSQQSAEDDGFVHVSPESLIVRASRSPSPEPSSLDYNTASVDKRARSKSPSRL